MTIDSFRYSEVQREVQSYISAGRIPESQRFSWETRLLKEPRSIRELQLTKPVVPPMPPDPEPDPDAYVSRSGGQQLQDWLNEQPDFGRATGSTPARPEFRGPVTTASGIPIEAVKRLPWQVQHSVARIPDRAAAQAAIEEYSGPDGDLFASIASEPNGPAYYDVLDYLNAVEAWRSHPGVPLSVAQRDAAKGLTVDSGVPLEGDLAQSVRDLESASSLLNSLDAELARHNPGYRDDAFSAFGSAPVLERDADKVEIETVEIRAVELLNVGRFQTGDGPRTITKQDLVAMVTASRDHRTARPVLKLGHKSKLSEGGGIGHVTNLRLSQSGTVLVGDFEGVPKRLASLVIGTKSTPAPYRSRSVEYSRRVRAGQTTHPIVLTALALLGQDRPANQSLADVLSIYNPAPAPVGAKPLELTTDIHGGPA